MILNLRQKLTPNHQRNDGRCLRYSAAIAIAIAIAITIAVAVTDNAQAETRVAGMDLSVMSARYLAITGTLSAAQSLIKPLHAAGRCWRPGGLWRIIAGPATVPALAMQLRFCDAHCIGNLTHLSLSQD